MQKKNDPASDDVEFARFEEEFQTWRRSWLSSLIDDYGELSRYRGRNALLKPPAPDECRIIFFGDSITEGWNLEGCFPGEPYINRGIGAQTTPQMLLRFRQDVVGLKPRAVVIHAGTNDLGGNTGAMPITDTKANYASMIDIAQANGIRVFVSSLLPPAHKATLISRYNFLKRPPEKILEFNRWLEDYGRRHTCVFLDYFSAMIGADGCVGPDLCEDGLHPSPAGYRIMTKVAQTAIGRPSSS